MELREQLARRLGTIKWPGLGRPVLQSNGTYYTEPVAKMEIDPSQGNSATWGDLADECIRQMKWTHMSAKWACPENMTWEDEVLEDGDHPLTLAPEDWQP